jgi:hypothetical protein
VGSDRSSQCRQAQTINRACNGARRNGSASSGIACTAIYIQINSREHITQCAILCYLFVTLYLYLSFVTLLQSWCTALAIREVCASEREIAVSQSCCCLVASAFSVPSLRVLLGVQSNFSLQNKMPIFKGSRDLCPMIYKSSIAQAIFNG